MTVRNILPWVAVHHQMNDEYRQYLVETALAHIPNSTHATRKYAVSLLSKWISIPGFRSNWIGRAPLATATSYVLQHIQNNNFISTAIICLWAEAKQEFLNEIINRAKKDNLNLAPDWDWLNARDGFCAPYVLLDELIDAMTTDRPERECDDLKLGALWLSSGYGSDENDQAINNKTVEVKDIQVEMVEPSLKLIEGSTTLVTKVVNELFSTDLHGSQVQENVFSDELPSVLENVTSKYQTAVEAYQLVLAEASKLMQYIQESNYEQAKNYFTLLGESLTRWDVQRTHLRTELAVIFAGFKANLAARPDMDQKLAELLESKIQATIDLEPIVQFVNDLNNQIIQYDIDKQKTLQQISQLSIEKKRLESDLRIWQSEKIDNDQIEHHQFVDLSKETLRNLSELLRKTQNDCDSLISRLNLQSETNAQNITEKLNEYIELRISKEPIKSLVETLDTSRDSWKNWSIQHRKALLADLQSVITEFRVQQQAKVVSEIANRLAASWSNDLLIDLLASLADDKLDIEALLLLLASNKVHGRTSHIILRPNTLDVLISGLDQIKSDSSLHNVLCLIAEDFVSGWKVEDMQSRLKLCLHLLFANYSTDFSLPVGFLWMIENEWPHSNMPTWTKFWQLSRDGIAPQIYNVDDRSKLIKELEYKHFLAKQAFEREQTGVYVRSRSVDDKKYRSLLNKHILPRIEHYLTVLIPIELELLEIPPYKLAHTANNLESIYNTLEQINSPEYIDELFQDALADARLTNYHVFHGRNTVANARDASTILFDYAIALRHFCRFLGTNSESISPAMLKSETQTIFQEGSYEFFMIDALAQSIKHHSTSVDNQQTNNIDNIFVEKLLSNAICARRIPRVIVELTKAEFDWGKILQCLLTDLANPTENAEISAQILLDGDAFSQVNLLSQSISLEKQKQANLGFSDQIRAIDKLVNEFAQLGDVPLIPEKSRQLGRLNLILKNLRIQLDRVRNQKSQQQQQSKAQISEIRSKINQLDEQIFAMRDEMVKDAFEILQSYLESARKALSKSDTVSHVSIFVNSLEYQIIHKSFSLADLKDLEYNLPFQNVQESKGTAYQTIEDVLELMKNGHGELLGFSADNFESSKIDTRTRILEEWLYLRDEISEFRADRIDIKSKANIQSLYRYFAQMISMKYASLERGEAVFEHPIIYSVYQLEYPRTPALDKRCTLIAIPGRETNINYLDELDELIVQNQWLENDDFVFLLTPSNTKQIHKRFSKRHGMVIIDSEVLLTLILAEKKKLTPIACLRPLMLNAKGGNIDIFTVNHLVHARTSIFVGRDSLVSRILSSGQSYVIFGGRRIGKSSVLYEIKQKLRSAGFKIYERSFDELDCSDNTSARKIARALQLEVEVNTIDDLKPAVINYLDKYSGIKIAILLDEVDAYIQHNRKRHGLIQTLRTLCDLYHERFRVIIVGFTDLYDCIKGRGPYTASSNPWTRMFNNAQIPLGNLSATQAEAIVRVGFLEILGWSFESSLIPQLIVTKTGGHPNFVQFFCMKVQNRVIVRGDKTIRVSDIDAVFNDESPRDSFIAHVKETLAMNITDAFGRYLLLFLAIDNKGANQFHLAQAEECAGLFAPLVSSERLQSNLERLMVTSVIREIRQGTYEFTVPDYPMILTRLGHTSHLEELERKIKG